MLKMITELLQTCGTLCKEIATLRKKKSLSRCERLLLKQKKDELRLSLMHLSRLTEKSQRI